MLTNRGFSENWRADRVSFDRVASYYDQYRPGYPRELVEDILRGAQITSGAHLLEVGCGTGIATRMFAHRGYKITCVDPGVNMVRAAAASLQDDPNIQFEINAFEDWSVPQDWFDLIYSGQAFHWVPKDKGFLQAAHALKRDGWLALFWNLVPPFEGDIARELDEIYKELVPEITGPPPLEEHIQLRSDEITQSGQFRLEAIRRYPWSQVYTAQQYLGLLNTYSDHLRLPAERFQALIRKVEALISRHGGQITKPYLAVLYMAQSLNRVD